MKSTLLKEGSGNKRRTKTRLSKFKTSKMIELTPKNQEFDKCKWDQLSN